MAYSLAVEDTDIGYGAVVPDVISNSGDSMKPFPVFISTQWEGRPLVNLTADRAEVQGPEYLAAVDPRVGMGDLTDKQAVERYTEGLDALLFDNVLTVFMVGIGALGTHN